MLIGTLVGVQTICVGFTAYLAYKTSKKTVALKLVSKDKITGFKHYKPGGF
jgi:hypothetical protein